MRTILFGLLVVAFAVPCIAVDKEVLEKTFTVDFSMFHPERWSVKRVIVNALPFNHGIKEGQRKGTSIEFVGPSMVNKGPKGAGSVNNDEAESFSIWIMPADYTPTPIPLNMMGQATEASLIGWNETVVVYGKSFFGTPSWPTWQQDVVGRLGLKSTRAAPAAQLIRIPGP